MAQVTKVQSVQDRIDILRSLGVDIRNEEKWVGEVATPERHKEDVPGTFRSVLLPFGPQEWMDIAQSEGKYYIGGCCGNMSALQDNISHAFRFGGDLSDRDLGRVAELASGHDGFETFKPNMTDETFDGYVDIWDTLDPWAKLGLIWSAIASVIKKSDADPYKNREDPEEKPGYSIIYKLSHAIDYLSFSDMFEVREEDKSQHEARRKLNLAKVYPLVSELKTMLEEQDINFSGFAVVDVNNELATNGYGPCIYFSKEEAQYILGVSDAELHMVPCTVDIENGLVLNG